MRALRLVLDVAAGATVGLALASGEHMLPAESSLRDLKHDLVSDKIRTVKVLFIPYEVVTRVRLTPELLERTAEINRVLEMDASMRSSLLEAIDRARVRESVSAPDIRWGAVFYGSDGTELHSIYLSGKVFFRAGRRGIIDGNPAKLNDALIDWFEGTFGDLVSRPNAPR
ncbi:MAG: hypothetical protein KatS3mg076_0030 [Candidatus Binatia bacterium]|nr:MAG: hypothetical protein KatS3mg076_0030 [Candidatus Binatia bacterium]